jgi:hypothetical protein
MDHLIEPAYHHLVPGDAMAFILSRLPNPDSAAADIATGGSLSFLDLLRGALSLAAALRLGLRCDDAVLVLPQANSLLLPQVLLGVLTAEISAVVHGSGAVIVVAAPDGTRKAAAAAHDPVGRSSDTLRGADQQR